MSGMDIPRGNRLKAVREDMGLTQERMAAELGTTQASVSRWEKGAEIDEGWLIKYAEIAGRAPAEIRYGIDAVVSIHRTKIIGAVQAGQWNDDPPWLEDDLYAVDVPVLPEFAHMTRFGLEVRGPSMNRIYPEGTVLICVPLAELERWPESEEMVIVQRRGASGLETTVKEFVHDDSGAWLWPRSNHPEHQQPIPLPRPHIDGDEQQLALADFMAVDEDHGEEIAVIALVIQSVRNETTHHSQSKGLNIEP